MEEEAASSALAHKVGLVVLIDALGTKQKAVEVGWSSLLEKWAEIARLALGQKEFSITTVTISQGKQESSERIPVKPHAFAFSDTLLMAFESGHANGVLLAGCTPFLRGVFVESLRAGIPLRGAAALGDFYIRDQVCLGPAVTMAAAWFERGDWAGIVLTPEAAEEWKEYLKSEWNSDRSAFTWHPFCVPASPALAERSAGNPPLMLCLSWPPYHQERGMSREGLRAATWKAFRGVYDRVDAERKMRNTLAFFDETCKLADKVEAETPARAAPPSL